MKFNGKLVVCGSILLAILLAAPNLLPQKAPTKPTTVVVDWRKMGRSYTVDGHQANDLLRSLADVYERFGAKQPINVLVDSRLSFEEILLVEGVGAKVPLNDFRFFIFSAESHRMSEVTFGPWEPFSTDVPAK